MKIFFAGGETRQYYKILQEAKVENKLESFFSLGMGKNPPGNQGFKHYLLDSGGFSARTRGMKIDVQDFVAFLNKYDVEFAFNLDTNDIEESLSNQRTLDLNTNTYIMPVYHGVEWQDPYYRDLLDYYIEFYPYIAVGGLAGKENNKDNARRFLNYVFKHTKNKTMVHGLVVTSDTLLRSYPFFTVDSTSWLAVARFASSSVHSEKMAKVRARTRPYTENVAEEIPFWVEKGKKMDELWKRRGFTFPELDKERFLSQRGKNIPTYKEWKEKRG